MRRALACAASLVFVAFLLAGCGRSASVPTAEPPSAQGTFPLKSEVFDGENAGTRLPLVRRIVWLYDTKPAQLRMAPKDMTGRVLYGTAKIGGRDTTFAVAGDVLCVDSDGDGDLSDEKALKPVTPAAAEGLREGTPREVCWVADVPGAAGASEVRLKIIGGSRGYLILTPRDCRVGRVRLDGKDYRVAVADGNYDGKYDGVAVMPFNLAGQEEFDDLAVDLDGDGIFGKDFIAGEAFYLTKMTRVNGVYYSVKVEPDGSAITMEKVQPKLGTLDVGAPGAELSLFSDCGMMRLAGETGCWQLPEGRYDTVATKLARTGKDGAEQSVSGYGEMGALQEFAIAPGKTLSRKMGPPLTLKTAVSIDKGLAAISLTLKGRGGETYTPMAYYGKRPAGLPTVRIVGESGKVLSSGEFEFG